MRYAKLISTDEIMMSADVAEETLRANMESSGYAPEDIQIVETDQATLDALISTQDTPTPMRKWELDMRSSDMTMLPRYLEDHIRDDHGGVAGNANLQAKYDQKVALRNSKPS